jgi:multiple sugar transport system permease protein
MLTQVMLPLLQPTIVIVLLLRLAESLKLFDIPFAMTGGGPGIATQPFSMLAFRTGLRFFDLGYASAMAYALLIAVMIVITLFFRRLRENYG